MRERERERGKEGKREGGTVLTLAAAPPGTIDFIYIPISECSLLLLHLPWTVTPKPANPLSR